MNLDDQFELTYCTNIHPGPDWHTTFESLQDHVPAIKAQVNYEGSFGIGLRLSNMASKELLQRLENAQTAQEVYDLPGDDITSVTDDEYDELSFTMKDDPFQALENRLTALRLRPYRADEE